MPQDTGRSRLTEKTLRWPIRWTLIGLLAERAVRAFWPLWTLAATILAAVMVGLQDNLAIELVWIGTVAGGAGLVWALWFGLRRMRWPRRAEAVDRLDATLAGRPIAALRDLQAVGTGDPGSEALWQAHRVRMRDHLAGARPAKPDLRLARFDRYGLRYVALTLLAVAMLFGSLWRIETLAGMAPGGPATMASGPSWEGWIEPPAYTGRPSLYLNDLEGEVHDVPAGSRISLRLYGQVGALTVSETVSARTEVESVTEIAQDFEVRQSGVVSISGPGGREWTITIARDAAPVIDFSGTLTREADGRMVQPFAAADDYGVDRAVASITLDPDRADRRHGLRVAPEPRAAIEVDLPMPLSGDRISFSEEMIEDFSKHPFANLPVTIVLQAWDAADNAGQSAPLVLDALPGRRFFDPLAKAIIEQRRDLLWNRANSGRVAQILRAVSYQPEGMFRTEVDYLRLRFIARQLEGAAPVGPSDALVEDTAEALWRLALRIEEGDLSDALARLRRAQDRLSEAMRDGASPEEIAQLMQDLREAMQDYMRQLAEQAQRDGTRMSDLDLQNMQTMTGDQLQSMLDRLQELMEQGRMAEAQQLLDQLAQMMQNLQMAQSGGAAGQGGPGQQALSGLQETLRDQQDLSDDSFQGLQDQFDPGQGPGSEQGESPGADLGGQLAQRQQDLRDSLRRQQSDLPGAGAGADAAREALDRAGRAMDQAEEALRDNQLADAIDSQSEAMEALRDGIRSLGEELAQQQQQGQGQQGQQLGESGQRSSLDPLGRENGGEGPLGTRDTLVPNDDVYRRARDLLDEIRRRSGDQSRPEMELDYLKRLLDRF
ncbi:MAG: TIGR02302 family protein [Qingshengfaniella sp.]